MHRILISLKEKMARGLICPFTGAIFHNIQTAIYSRSQVSDYKTIGPLVLFYIVIFFLYVIISYIYRTPLVYHRVVKLRTGMWKII